MLETKTRSVFLLENWPTAISLTHPNGGVLASPLSTAPTQEPKWIATNRTAITDNIRLFGDKRPIQETSST